MSETRYQVFVSLTYSDLKEERSRVSQALMEMNCIPAGMELFPATDENQFEFIKTVIDESDYYVLIIGGRYGSLTQEGISFTEQEYEYAVSKGLEICAFIHSSPDIIPQGKSEKNPDLTDKLERFKSRVSNGRLVKFWSDPRELPGLVVVSLNSAIRRKPAVGWIRGNREAPPEALSELLALQEENSRLKEAVKSRSTTSNDEILGDLNRVLTLEYKVDAGLSGILGNQPGLMSAAGPPKKMNLSISSILEKMSYDLMHSSSLENVKELIPENRQRYGIGATGRATPQVKAAFTNESRDKIKLALLATGIVEDDHTGKYTLTAYGRKAFLEVVTRA